MIVKGEDLLQGNVSEVQVSLIQMSKNHNYSHFKKRICDVLDAKGMADVKADQIRMWICTNKHMLHESFKSIAESGEKMQ